jgi:hypothetical protein
MPREHVRQKGHQYDHRSVFPNAATQSECDLTVDQATADYHATSFNPRKREADRKAKTDAEAATRRATDAQVLEDTEHLVGAWNDRQTWRMPLLFAPCRPWSSRAFPIRRPYRHYDC